MRMNHDSESAQHWETVYRQKDARSVSWFRMHLEDSLALLEQAGLDAGSQLIDVGGGASTLVDDLLDRGVARVCVLDLSAAALSVAQARLGARAAAVDWRVGDITTQQLPAAAFTHWHDRAVLHFLTDAAATAAYARQARQALQPGGYAVIGGFAPDGPERCSGLTVARRSADDIAAVMGEGFELIDARRQIHHTPGGAAQSFAYALLRRGVG